MHENKAQRTDELARFVGIGEAARRLGVSNDTIRRRIKSGELPAVLFARAYRIELADVDALVDSQRAA